MVDKSSSIIPLQLSDGATTTNTGSVIISPQIPIHPPPFHTLHFPELTDLKSTLQQASNDLVFLESLETTLKTLTKKIITRRKEYAVYTSLLNEHLFSHSYTFPTRLRQINDLPPEILGTIFSFCPQQLVYKKFFTYNKTPWTLSWTCGYWRQTALGTSELWSTVPLIDIGDPRSVLPLEQPFFKEILNRSDVSTLSTTLRSRYNGISFSLLGNLIAPHFPRMKTLTLKMPQREAADLANLPSFLMPDKGFESLTTFTLDISQSYGDGRSFTTGLPHILLPMPALRTLTLKLNTTSCEDLTIHSLPLPWKQLTSLTLCKLNTESAFEIISSATQLKFLKVVDLLHTQAYASRLTGKGHRKITSQLGHLAIQGTSLFSFRSSSMTTESFINAFFESMVLPHLKTLEIAGDAKLFDPNRIVSFLERAECSLTELSLPHESPLVVQRILLRCPEVRKLHLLSVNDRVLVLLKRQSNGSWLIPKMTHLVLRTPCIRDPHELQEILLERSAREPGLAEIAEVELLLTHRYVEREPRTYVMGHTDTSSYDSDSDSVTSDSLSEPVYDFLDTLRTYARLWREAGSGYDLVNDTSHANENIVKIEELCEKLEEFDYKGTIYDSVFEVQRSHIIKLYLHLDELENEDQQDPRVVACKHRLHSVLRVWTHDPWVFETPPPGWTRSKAEDDTEIPYKRLTYRK